MPKHELKPWKKHEERVGLFAQIKEIKPLNWIELIRKRAFLDTTFLKAI